MAHSEIVKNIFDEGLAFTEIAVQVFQYQNVHNPVYRSWNDILHIDIASVSSLTKIPFLPISFFKTHKVVNGEFEPQLIFESSDTTRSITSRHYMKDSELYKKSFLKEFEKF